MLITPHPNMNSNAVNHSTLEKEHSEITMTFIPMWGEYDSDTQLYVQVVPVNQKLYLKHLICIFKASYVSTATPPSANLVFAKLSQSE